MSNSEAPIDEQSAFSYEAFPFPKMVQLFNFLFPKKKGAKEFFTMENLRRFAPYSPFLAIGLLLVIFLLIPIDAIYVSNKPLGEALSIFDSMGLVFGLIGLIKWLILAFFAKSVGRSPTVAIAMTAVASLRAVALLSLVHLFGFVFFG